MTALLLRLQSPRPPYVKPWVDWIYVVWIIPGHPALCGIHVGGDVAWEFISGKIGRFGRRDAPQYRGVRSLAEAVEVYVDCAETYGVALKPLVHVHAVRLF